MLVTHVILVTLVTQVKTCRVVTVQTVTLHYQKEAFSLLISGESFAEKP